MGAMKDRELSILQGIRRGRISAATKVLLYGVEGVGKSTWASQWPAPIYLCSEAGTEQLDVDRLPEPRTWSDVLQAVDALTSEQHTYQTLVVDTVDWLEPLLWDGVCQRNKWSTIEAPGYGRGYVEALGEWRLLLRRLEAVRARGIHVVLLGHSTIRRVSPPDSEPYDRYALKVHEKAAALLREWSDAVLFAQYDQVVGKAKDARAARAHATGERVLRTVYGGGWDAKNRLGLADTIPMQAEVVLHALQAPRREPGLAELLERIGDHDYTAQVLTWVDQQPDRAQAEQRAIKRCQEKLNGS